MSLSRIIALVLVIVSAAIAYVFLRRFIYTDAGHHRYQDSNGNEMGLERNRGSFRAVIILTNPELDWFYYTDCRAKAHQLEFFDTRAPQRCRKIAWGQGTLLLYISRLGQFKPWVIYPNDNAIWALFEDVQRRDNVRWALESELFQAGAAIDLPQPIVEPLEQSE